jgi:hypothetical protein
VEVMATIQGSEGAVHILPALPSGDPAQFYPSGVISNLSSFAIPLLLIFLLHWQIYFIFASFH